MGQPTVAAENEYKVNDFRQRKSRQSHEYNLLPDKDLKAILEVELESDRFGSKINFLVRHLLWLQQNDSNIKSVVFSAWADGLHSQSCHV
jgi:E3 ubiquitin-protein ligase SHPRH